jgi:hypothetical protein|tara:strand:+ start:129 stop:308 length:180 start_codon:yes stop_codon:yes gene_type:complete
MSIQQKRQPLDFNQSNDSGLIESLSSCPDRESVQSTVRITNLSLQDEDGVILEFKSYSN